MTIPNETDRTTRRAAVYRLYDAAGTLLYIGSAYDPDHRCKSHRKQPWWPEVARRTDEWHPARGVAYVEELKAIAVERSKYNAMGAPGYTTPQTEAVRQRNALAKLREKLISEGYGVSGDVRAAAYEAGYSSEEAHRLAKEAEIQFLEHTGLFARSVKWRRQMIALHGH